jgi:hypothetical protein
MPIRANANRSRCDKPTGRALISRRSAMISTSSKSQLSRQPDRRWLRRMGLIDSGSVWALLAAVALMLAR